MSDPRQVIRSNNNLFTQFPYSGVAAVDTTYSYIGDDNKLKIERGNGSGVFIGSNHILTAGHVVYRHQLPENNEGTSRVTTVKAQDRLISRFIGRQGDPSFNILRKDFLLEYDNDKSFNKDIALLYSNVTEGDGDNFLSSSQVFGLTAFVNPKDALNPDIKIETAGYPGDNITNKIKNRLNDDPNRRGRELVRSPGAGDPSATISEITNDMLFTTSTELLGRGGQSGSGVWSTYLGDRPRVLGILVGRNEILNETKGLLINTDLYADIISQIKQDAGTLDANLLPENLIIGSDSNSVPIIGGAFGGDDEIIGTYRRERIVGQGGEDKIFGEGADDRLEGENGEDYLNGGEGNDELSGGKGKDSLFGGLGDDELDGGENIDQALFSDTFASYEWKITDSNPNNPAFTFERLLDENNKDTLENVEFGVFEFIDGDKNSEDDDKELFYVPLEIDPNKFEKLKDGPLIYPKQKIFQTDEDGEQEEIGTMTVESPAWMFDGDVEYKLTIGLDVSRQHNVALIIDNSSSMTTPYSLNGNVRTLFEHTQNAFVDLVDSFKQSGIENIDFGVVDFNETANLSESNNASIDNFTETKNIINNVIPPEPEAGKRTNYADALTKAVQYFQANSVKGDYDIAFFLSDGQPNAPENEAVAFTSTVPLGQSLRNATNSTRAFGFGKVPEGFDNTSIGQEAFEKLVRFNRLVALKLIDPDAKLLDEIDDLFDEFNKTVITRDKIERIDVKKDKVETPIATILPEQLTQEGLNLVYEGEIDGLTVSREAENDIGFEIVFKENDPNYIPTSTDVPQTKPLGIEDVSVDYKITTGQEQIKDQSENGTVVPAKYTANTSDFATDSGFLSANLLAGDLEESISLNSSSIETPTFDTDSIAKTAPKDISGDNHHDNIQSDRFALMSDASFSDLTENDQTLTSTQLFPELSVSQGSVNLNNSGGDILYPQAEFETNLTNSVDNFNLFGGNMV